eukprot:COSAG01_NODE_6234_length_3776_cov_65.869731_4_plen_76_part_00
MRCICAVPVHILRAMCVGMLRCAMCVGIVWLVVDLQYPSNILEDWCDSEPSGEGAHTRTDSVLMHAMLALMARAS